MTGLIRHIGIAAPFPEDNVNTDLIIPSREIRRVSKKGLGVGLFAGLRYRGDGTAAPDFILNRRPFDRASILISGRNFGCGSSREHAVWALYDYGFRAVLAESFGAIFYNNCIGNGIVPVTLEPATRARIAAWVEADPAGHLIAVDLDRMTVRAGGAPVSFTLAPDARRMLREGLSPIDLTLDEHRAALARFAAGDRQARPWLYRAEVA